MTFNMMSWKFTSHQFPPPSRLA